jgi:hypothetical protein
VLDVVDAQPASETPAASANQAAFSLGGLT